MRFKYYAIYKPFAMLSQFTPEQPEDITLANFYHFEKDVYPVGRLDKDSEGLLLLTNDSALNQKILHPKKTILKTYWVQVEGHATQLQLQQLWQGVTINVNGKAHITQPCKAKLLPSESSNSYQNKYSHYMVINRNLRRKKSASKKNVCKSRFTCIAIGAICHRQFNNIRPAT